MTLRLAAGAARLPEDVRHRHARYLTAAQRSDGGFAGREGESDLYYTGFALRSLAILGVLEGDIARQAARFLRGRLVDSASIVDFLSLIYAAGLLEMTAGLEVFAGSKGDWRREVTATLERLRRDDGGYARSLEGQSSSTYHTFLVVVSMQWLGVPLAHRESLTQFVSSRRRDDGGFVEIGPMKRSGTNPTAAAIALLRIAGVLQDEVRRSTVRFLSDMQTDEGGLRANTRIPIADLLSTFTGLLTLSDLGALDEVNMRMVSSYVHSLQRPEGGFRGAAWDEGYDVEYTFYGLGTLGLLARAFDAQ